MKNRNVEENMFIQSWVCHDKSKAMFCIPETATREDLENLRKFAEFVINYKLRQMGE